MREPVLVASSSASARGVLEGILAPADETASDHGPGPDRGLSEALDEHVREQGSCKIVAYGRELSGLYWLDSIVVLLSLGHMGILMHAAALTSACITSAFLLAPRRAKDGLAQAQQMRRSSDGQVRAPQVDPTGAVMFAHSGADGDPAAGLAETSATAETARRGEGGAPEQAVLPGLQAHWAALGQEGLPAVEAVDLLLGLVEWAAARRRNVRNVLDAYGVPYNVRDGSNLVSGLLDVHPEALPKGQISVARREAAPSAWSVSGLATAVRAALPWIDAEAFAADVIDGRPTRVRVGAQGTRMEEGAPVLVSLVGDRPMADVHALPATVAMAVATTMDVHATAATMAGAVATTISRACTAQGQMEDEIDTVAPLSQAGAGVRSSSGVVVDKRGALMAAIAECGGFEWSKSDTRLRKRRELRESGAHHLLLAQERHVREYLNFSHAVGIGWPDHLAAMLSRSTLQIYIDWVVEPDGRLHCLHEGQTRAELQAAISSAYRLPVEVVVHAAHHLLTHLRDVEGAALCKERLCFVDPGGHCKHVTPTNLPSAKMLRKAMSGLNMHADAFGAGHAGRSEETARAYDMSLRELNRQPRRCASALLPAMRRAIFACLDLESPHDLRLALWVALATRLKARTYEGISLLHADLVLDANDRTLGEWLVGARTKTTDGVDGRVTGWDHLAGCKRAGLSVAELLLLDVEELRQTACRCRGGVLSYDGVCHICLTVLMRQTQANVDAQGYAPVFQAIDAGGAFDGRGGWAREGKRGEGLLLA